MNGSRIIKHSDQTMCGILLVLVGAACLGWSGAVLVAVTWLILDRNTPIKLHYRGYVGDIWWSSDDAIFYGRILGTGKDCVSYEGNTLATLEESFQTAVEDYLSTKKNLG